MGSMFNSCYSERSKHSVELHREAKEVDVSLSNNTEAVPMTYAAIAKADESNQKLRVFPSQLIFCSFLSKRGFF